MSTEKIENYATIQPVYKDDGIIRLDPREWEGFDKGRIIKPIDGNEPGYTILPIEDDGHKRGWIPERPIDPGYRIQPYPYPGDSTILPVIEKPVDGIEPPIGPGGKKPVEEVSTSISVDKDGVYTEVGNGVEQKYTVGKDGTKTIISTTVTSSDMGFISELPEVDGAEHTISESNGIYTEKYQGYEQQYRLVNGGQREVISTTYYGDNKSADNNLRGFPNDDNPFDDYGKINRGEQPPKPLKVDDPFVNTINEKYKDDINDLNTQYKERESLIDEKYSTLRGEIKEDYDQRVKDLKAGFEKDTAGKQMSESEYNKIKDDYNKKLEEVNNQYKDNIAKADENHKKDVEDLKTEYNKEKQEVKDQYGDILKKYEDETGKEVGELEDYKGDKEPDFSSEEGKKDIDATVIKKDYVESEHSGSSGSSGNSGESGNTGGSGYPGNTGGTGGVMPTTGGTGTGTGAGTGGTGTGSGSVPTAGSGGGGTGGGGTGGGGGGAGSKGSGAGSESDSTESNKSTADKNSKEAEEALKGFDNSKNSAAAKTEQGYPTSTSGSGGEGATNAFQSRAGGSGVGDGITAADGINIKKQLAICTEDLNRLRSARDKVADQVNALQLSFYGPENATVTSIYQKMANSTTSKEQGVNSIYNAGLGAADFLDAADQWFHNWTDKLSGTVGDYVRGASAPGVSGIDYATDPRFKAPDTKSGIDYGTDPRFSNQNASSNVKDPETNPNVKGLDDIPEVNKSSNSAPKDNQGIASNKTTNPNNHPADNQGIASNKTTNPNNHPADNQGIASNKTTNPNNHPLDNQGTVGTNYTPPYDSNNAPKENQGVVGTNYTPPYDSNSTQGTPYSPPNTETASTNAGTGSVAPSLADIPDVNTSAPTDSISDRKDGANAILANAGVDFTF